MLSEKLLNDKPILSLNCIYFQYKSLTLNIFYFKKIKIDIQIVVIVPKIQESFIN